MTQEQAKQAKRPQTKTKPKTTKKKSKPPVSAGTKIALKVLKYASVPILLLICLYIGLYIGYSVVGKQPSSEIWELQTWKHMYDLVFAEG